MDNKHKELKKITDWQLSLVLKTITRKRQDHEKDNFKAGYIQAMLNYCIMSSKQYEKIYEQETFCDDWKKHAMTGQKEEVRETNKISMFKLLNKYKIGKQVYYILENGLALIIAKENQVFGMKDEFYSLMYNAEDIYIPIESFDKMFIYEDKITILRKS